ncbi:MAG TPA: helicase-related protein [Blastocatellia bacterium]|nr:helicase-related protein [Blastocatellia bacterium]
MIEKRSYLKRAMPEIPGLSPIPTADLERYRPNLCYEVARVSNDGEKQLTMVRLLRECGGAGLICAATARTAKLIADNLKQAGFEVEPDHDRLGAREREENRARFAAGQLKALVTTDPLQLGPESPELNFVIHHDAPSSLSTYFQESSLAGSDGRPARCILLFQLADCRAHFSLLSGRYPRPNEAYATYEALQRLRADGAPVSLERLQNNISEVPRADVRMILSLLKDAGLVNEHRGARFRLRTRGLSALEVERLAAEAGHRSVHDRERTERLMRYGQSPECRWKLLLAALSEDESVEGCGHCDNCLQVAAEQSTRSEERRTHAQPSPLFAFAHQPQVQIRPGDIVKLREHGEVKVKAVEGDKIVVSLRDGETKKFKQEWVIR